MKPRRSWAIWASAAVAVVTSVSSCTADERPNGSEVPSSFTLPEEVYDASVVLTLDGEVRELAGECRSIGRLITFTTRDEIGSLRFSLEIPNAAQHGPPTDVGLLELGLPDGTYFMEDFSVSDVEELGRSGEIRAGRLLSSDDKRASRDIRIQWECT